MWYRLFTCKTRYLKPIFVILIIMAYIIWKPQILWDYELFIKCLLMSSTFLPGGFQSCFITAAKIWCEFSMQTCGLSWNHLKVPFGAKVLWLPVRNWHQGLVWAGKWRRRGPPALQVRSAVEHCRNRWALQSPHLAGGRSVSCCQRLRVRFLLHGLHLVLLCTAPKDRKRGQSCLIIDHPK